MKLTKWKWLEELCCQKTTCTKINNNLPLYLDYGSINMSELEGSENKNKIKSKVNWNTRRQIKSSLAMTIHAISDNVIYHQ